MAIAGDVEHVDVLREEEPRELHRRVLGHVARDQLALGLGEVERQAVGLADHRDDVDHERREQRDDPPEPLLRRHDLRRRHRPGDDEDRHQRQTHRELVGDHLRGRADRAEQRVRGAGRPAAEHDAVHADRRARQDVQHRHREVGQLQRGLDAEHADRRPERDDREHQERAEHRDHRRDDVDHLVGGLDGHVLLDQQLHRVGERLEQAERAVHVGAGPLLHAADDLALEPDREQHADQQEHDDRDGLDQDDPPRVVAEVGRDRRRARRAWAQGGDHALASSFDRSPVEPARAAPGPPRRRAGCRGPRCRASSSAPRPRGRACR